MSRMKEDTLKFAVNAYRHLREVAPEQHYISAWHDYDSHNPQWLRFLMLRRHSYYGEWALFDGGSYVASFDERLLATLFAQEEEKIAEKRAALEQSSGKSE